MSTISGVSGSGDAWANMKAQRSQMQAKMFAKVDTDSSGGVDKTELQSLLADVAKKTGVTNSSSSDELFSKMDSNSDGSLSSDELGQGMQSIMPPPPSTMDFAQSRSDSTSSGDDLFTKVDTDGDGSVSKAELQSLMKMMDKLASDGSPDGTSSASTTSTSSEEMFAKLDTDSDGSLSQTEFEAGRPQGGNGPQGAGGMPPPPPSPDSSSATSSASSTTTYDPLDTNEDGTVSAQERLAGSSSSSSTDAVQTLLKAIDTNSDKQISASETDAFIEQLTSQLEAMTESGQDTGSSAKSTQNSVDLAELVKQAYEQIMAQQAKGATLSALA